MNWWVTPDAYLLGQYTKIYHALRHWITTEFPFNKVHYSNAETPDL